MKERSIILRAHEVLGVIAGTRTQLRRPLKSQPAYPDEYPPLPCQIDSWLRHCPLGRVGTKLWVRETFALIWPAEYAPENDRDCYVQYRADWPNDKYPGHWPDDCGDDENCGRWKSSTQMPRWASRLTLEVVGVRVERLNSITDADAIAEGMPHPTLHSLDCESTPPRQHYREHWDAYNKKHPWSANPFVWRLEFRKVTP